MADLALIEPPGTARNALMQVRGLLAQPAVRRSLPLLGIVAVAAAVLMAWSLLSASPQRDLTPGASEADKAAIVQALDTAHIAYRIDGGTGAVRVTTDDFYKARMLLAAQGLPKAGGDVAGVTDPMPMGASEAVERDHLQGAREAELARTVESIESIASAKVHLADEIPSLFVRDRKAPTASVMLTMRGGRALSDSQAAAIANLVSASVPGLTPDAVTIVDQAGHLLSPPSGEGAVVATQLGFQAKVEDRYRQAVAGVLTPMLGADGFTAQVHADLDWASTDATRETYPEASRALRSEDQKWTSDSAQQPAVGIPGTLSNTAPPATTVSTARPSATTDTPPASQLRSQDVTRQFELGREVSVTRGAAGSVRRLSLAIALRDVPGKRRSPADLRAIEALVRGATGADASRGDIVAISAQPFVVGGAAVTSFWDAAWIPQVLRFGGLIVAAAAAWWIFGRRLLRRYDATTKALRETELGALIKSQASDVALTEGAVTLEMIEAAPSYAARAELVRDYVRQNPAQASLILKSMIKNTSGTGHE